MKTSTILSNALVILAITFLFVSCKKPPGEGGKASIRGTVWAEEWNGNLTIKNGDYAAYDEDVYIIYGDDVSYSDKTKTNYNGEFEFKYLRKGKYKIYVYSESKVYPPVSLAGKVSIVVDVEIKDKKEVKTMDKITIYK